MEIWFNPRCSKCRTAAATLDEAGAEYSVRRYLDEPPTRDELVEVLQRLGMQPWQITRTGDDAARELGVRELPRDAEHREQWLRLLTEHPSLIQRPIVLADDGAAVVPRDPRSLQEILGHR